MLDGQPYHLYYRVVKAVEFGIPQKRERMIIIGTTIDNVDVEKLWDLTIEDMKKEYPKYFDKVTVEDAIGNMPGTTIDGKIANPKPLTDYQSYLSCNSNTLTNHTKTKEMKALPLVLRKVEPLFFVSYNWRFRYRCAPAAFLHCSQQ